MIRKSLCAVLFLAFFISYPSGSCYCQNLSGHHPSTKPTLSKKATVGYAIPQWTVNNPFEQKVFIENNEGQFNGKTPSLNDKILFSTRINEVYLYFSATGITYRYDKYPQTDNDGESGKDNKDIPVKPETHFFSVKWKGANQNPEVVAEEQVSFYYTYPNGNKHTTIAHAFKKLLYKNIYPGIDIEYSLPDEKKGLEYSVIVHPGADLSLVKMLYSDTKNIEMRSGNIESQSSFGHFIDHAPTKTYYLDDQQPLACSFSLSGNEVSFSANYDHTKTLVIDPWVVNPGFANYNAGYDVCYDLRGNVYAYGSFAPYQEIKINSKGVIKWIFSIPNPDPQYADFAVDEATGISYDGSCTFPTIYKVDTAGLQTGSYFVNNTMEELWRMAFNRCENQLILAGGGVGLINQACTLDTSLGTLNAVNVLNAAGGHNDLPFLTIDNDNSSVYMGVAGNQYNVLYPNDVFRVMLPSLTPTQYLVPDGFNFIEGAPDVNYVDGVTGHALGMNGAVASPNWLYFYDGGTLRRYYKNTGATALTKTISNTPYTWGGIDVDFCDNLYLAKSDTIMVYDSGLTNIGKILAPNTVYDLHIAPNNVLVASGLQFVASFKIVTNPLSISFTNVSPASLCAGIKGKATATLNNCSNKASSYNYQWSNGVTTQTDTGLAPGIYSVTVSSGCDFTYSDSVKINNTSNGNYALHSNPLPICIGVSDTISAVGGKTYLWSNGATTSSIIVSPVTTTTYSVHITGNCGTKDTSIIVGVDSSVTLPYILGNDTICNGFQDVLIARGGGTYLWNTGETTATIVVSPTMTTIYSVTITNTCGSASTHATVFVAPTPIPEFIANPPQGCAPLCVQYKNLSTLSSGYISEWNWKFGNSNYLNEENPIFCYPDTGRFTTILTAVSDRGCSASLKIINMITVFSKPTAKFIYSPQLVDILEPTVQFTDQSTDAYGIAYRWWSYGDGANSFNLQNPIHTYTDTGVYCPQLVVMNNMGCMDTTTNCLFIEPLFTLYIPSAFTPNGDGINNVFEAKGTYIKSFEMYIFDRWGMKLFHSTDINKGWDGTVNGGTVISQEDSYVYKVTAIDWNNTPHSYIGVVTLLK